MSNLWPPVWDHRKQTWKWNQKKTWTCVLYLVLTPLRVWRSSFWTQWCYEHVSVWWEGRVWRGSRTCWGIPSFAEKSLPLSYLLLLWGYTKQLVSLSQHKGWNVIQKNLTRNYMSLINMLWCLFKTSHRFTGVIFVFILLFISSNLYLNEQEITC